MRTILSIIATVILVTPVGTHAASFLDTAGSEAERAIEELAVRGVVQGYKDGTFRPNADINRAELLTILVNASESDETEPKDLRCFKDFESKIPQWYARAVCLGKDRGIVQGYPDGTFRPEKPVNLVEALKMSFLSFGILPRASDEIWYTPYLLLARERSLLFPLLKDPGQKITRGHMAIITYALLMEREDSSEKPVTFQECGNGTLEGVEQCDDGNVVDSDGCSSICIRVPEPNRMSLLQINMEANGTVTNLARGQLKIPLLKFSAIANRQDALLTSLTFVPTIGTLLYGQHYTLVMDRNGDGLYEQIVQTDGRAERDRLIFDNLDSGGVRIPKDFRVPFMVIADLVSTLGPVGLQIEFGTTIPGYIEAQGYVDGLTLPGIETDGACTASDCFIQVNTRAGTTINVLSRGTLFVTESSTPTRSHILLGGSRTDTLLRLELYAEGETIDIKKLAFDGVPTSVDSLLLYRTTSGSFDPNSAVPFAQASNGQCPSEPLTRVCAVLPYSTFLVPPNQTVGIAVVATMKNDTVGAVSGQVASLNLSSAIGDSHAIEARGISSQADLDQNNGDGIMNGEIIIGQKTPIGNTQISARLSDVSLAKISSIVRSGALEEWTVPTGNSVIGSFTFTASPHTNTYGGSNDVVLKTLTFHITAQNVQLDPVGFRLSAEEVPSIALPCSASATTGSFDVTCTMIDSGTIRSRISETLSARYLLSGNVTNSHIANGPSTLVVSLDTVGQRGVTNSVEWSDQVTTFTWVDIPETSVMGTVFRSR